MKKLVWSETHLDGGRRFRGILARPPETTGSFQNIPVTVFGGGAGANWQPPVYYADVATIAYRAPRSDSGPTDGKVDVSSSSGPIDSAALSDGDLARSLALPFGPAQYAWIQFSFPKPRRIQALTMVVGRAASWEPLREPGPSGWLEAGDEGGAFRKA